ncbi:MAG: helix-turn-helix transcriptional regulator [Nanoarchaeota archaeon]|nr:helix-turn-helix transcriptional regulator [Nanoarchaeota archaeon]
MEIKNLNKSTFLDVMGDTPRNRILDFLISENGFDYTLKEIAENSKVGYATIKRIWNQFVKNNLVKETRRVGKAVFYKYDDKTNLGKKIKAFYLDILFASLEPDKRKAVKTQLKTGGKSIEVVA